MIRVGTVHLWFAFASLGFGAFIVLRRKGTTVHRWLGWAYAISMLGLNVTALMIYRLLGHFGPFHIAAIASLATLVVGMIAILTRRPRKRWLELHARVMSWSYVGLVAAAAAETTSRVPSAPFWGTVLAATLVVVALGGYLVNTRVPRAVRGMQANRDGVS